MGQTVTFEIAAHHAPAVTSFLEVSQAAENVGRVGGQAGENMKRGGEAAGAAWGRGLGVLRAYPDALLRMATGAAAVYAAIGQIRSELERVDQLRGQAMEGLAAAREPYKRATLQIKPETRRSEAFKTLTPQGIQARGSAASYYDDLAAMVNASAGQIPDEEVLQASVLVAKLAGAEGMSSEDSQALGQALIDRLQVQRRKGNKLDMKESLGMMLSGLPASRPTSMGNFATYEMQAQNVLMQNSGFTAEEAIGMTSTFGNLMIDKWGPQTRTNVLAFMADWSSRTSLPRSRAHR